MNEASPSAGHREVAEVLVDPAPERPETTLSRMSEARITAYVGEASGRHTAPEVVA